MDAERLIGGARRKFEKEFSLRASHVGRRALFFLFAAALWAQPDVVPRIQRALELRPGASVADIGSGGEPDLSMDVVEAAGDTGTVVYVDIDRAAVGKVAEKLKAAGLKNARAQLGRVDDPGLAAGSLDAALIVFAYHEMTEHASMLARIRDALRPGGRLAVIEASTEKNRGASREIQVKEHELSPQIVENELQSAGFEVKTEILREGDGVRRYLTVGRRSGG